MIQKLRSVILPGGFLPTRAHRGDAGADLRSPVDTIVPAHGSVCIDLLVAIEIPFGACGLLKSKSGLNVVHDITGEGVIDYGYTGTVRIKLYNHGNEDYHIHIGDKVTQILIVPCWLGDFEAVESLEETERGEGGFGSTGR